MNFGTPWCDAWYCTAFLQIGGLLEATAPFGIIAVVAFVVFGIWVNIDDGALHRKVRRMFGRDS